MKKAVLGVLCVSIAMTVQSSFAGPKMEMEDGFFRVRFMCQPHYGYVMDEDDAADQEQFRLRRARIIIDGQICDGVNFFMETDGVAAQFIQDAHVDFSVLKGDDHALGVKFGMILLPFSFESRSSAASLLGIDYNAGMIELPNTTVWRNTGIEVHGNYTDRIVVNAGVFDADGSRAEANVRLTGHIELALLGKAQTGDFCSQNRLKNETYLSIGAGIDSQAGSGVDAATNVIDNLGWVLDMQSCFSINEDLALTVNGAYYKYDNDANYTGVKAFVEGGLMYDKVQATFKYEMTDPDGVDSTDDITVGLHYFMKEHNVRGGIEYRTGDSADMALFGLQFML